MADSSNEATGIQVFLRVRPPNRDGAPSHCKRDDINLNQLTFDLPKKNADETVNNTRSRYSFEFGGGIIDERCTQREVFKTVGIPSIKNALAGYNSTIFAYGQTGSGKTFTITGGPERYDDRGIIPRSIAYLFKSIQSDEAQFGCEYKCYISYLEIYNQSGYDLLTQQTQSTSLNSDSIPKVQMLEDEDGNFHFKNLSVTPVQSEEESLNLLFRGDTNRAIAATELNQNSTRSHCIFCIMIEKRCASEDTVVRSKLNIVDLAGSERVSRSNSAGTTLAEAKYINSSLFFLEMVIVALYEREAKGKKDVHIPYRNSMMTSVLRDSLGGNCKTVMIATISPEAHHTDESISTCHFAQRVALVRNKAFVNEQIEPEMVIKRLKAEVRRLRDEVAFLTKNEDDSSHDGEDGEPALPSRHKEELEEAIQRYVADRDESSQLDFCGEITLPKIRTVCAVFKSMLNSGPSQRLPVGGGDESDTSDSDGHTSTARISSVAQKQYETTMRSNRRLEPNRQSAASIGVERPTQNQRKPTRPKKETLPYGVPVCRDEHVLEDPKSAFGWFKARYPSNQMIERKKAELKSSYDEAKSAGKQIEEIRIRIGKHECAIDEVRQRYAVNATTSPTEEKDDDYEMTSPEERRLLDLIDREKVTYKATLDSLRGLKGTIEESQRIVEKGRLRLQSDFDKWYQLMCNKFKEKPPANRELPSHAHSCSTEDLAHAEQSHPPPSAPNSIQSPEAQGDEDFKLPPGIQLTGNKEADEDIIAFYKAKEILLCRRKEGR